MTSAAALTVLPGAASAANPTTFCVNALSCPAGGINSSMGAALIGSRAGAGPATILVGPNAGGAAYAGPFSYSSVGSGADNVIHIVGQGRPVFGSSTAGKPVIELRGFGSSLSGVDVKVPALAGADGVLLDETSASDVTVTGGGSAQGINRGVVMTHEAELEGSRIAMASGFGIETQAGPSQVDHSAIAAPFGVVGGGSDIRLDNSRIHAGQEAIQLVGSGGGSSSLVGEGLLVIDSELTTTAADANGIFVKNAPARFIRTTLVGRSAAPAAGESAIEFQAQDRDANLTISTSVMGGYALGLERSAATGHVAPLEVEGSEWSAAADVTGGPAAGPIEKSAFVNAAPRFVNRLAGDLRLRGGDGAIDLNPDAPADVFNEADIDGHQEVDGDSDGVLESDAGAIEYLRRAPSVAAVTGPTSGAAGAPLAFATKAGDADGEVVKLRWSFGDGAKATGAAAKHAYAKPGTYSASVTATDEGGVTATRTLKVTVSDRTAPSISAAKLSVRRSALRRGRKARLGVTLSEAVTLRIRIVKLAKGGHRKRLRPAVAPNGHSVRTLKLSRRHLKALAKRREAIVVVAVDAAGNRSAPKRLRLKVRR